MRLRDIQRHMNALETEPERHLAYVQALPAKDMRKLWRVLPERQKRLLRDFHRALRARAVEYQG
jgi:galactokinase